MAARNPFASSDFFDPYAAVQFRRPALSTGYYFVRNLLLVGAVAGGFVAAYRNDVFRDLARNMGQEQRYLAAEKALVGSPGWGTPRSLEPVLKEAESAEQASLAAPAVTSDIADGTSAALVATSTPASTSDTTAAPSPAREPVAAATTAASTPVSEPQAAVGVAPITRTRASSLAPVSLDSLPVLNKGAAAQPAPAEPPARAPAPARAATAPAARSFVAAAPAPRPAPAPVERSRVKAIKVNLDDDAPAPASHTSPFVRHNVPAAAPAPAHEPPPAPEKPAAPKSKASDVHTGDNPLLAAVRGAVRTHPAKSSVPAAK